MWTALGYLLTYLVTYLFSERYIFGFYRQGEITLTPKPRPLPSWLSVLSGLETAFIPEWALLSI